MSLHTLAVVVLLLLIANETRGLYEEPHWTIGKILLGIPLNVLVWWITLTILL